ncbi:MAG: DUF4905 domain-containing protein [Opitutaceae bacterium]|nr:DUF4905 domain-containing protein [Cytophagales bacterium]
MQILFQHTFEHPVWRIVTSSSDISSWAIELRNPTKQEVEYYTINQKYKLKKLDTDLNWWSGVECVLGENIVFHEYFQPDLPIHKGVTVFNAEENHIEWSNEFIAFISANETHLKAKTIIGSTDQILLLDTKTGLEIEGSFFEDNIQQKQSVIIGQDQSYFKEIATFIQKFTHLKPELICEYSEENNAIVVSYYTKHNNMLENYLLVTNLTGEEQLHLCIATDLKGVATGTFNVSNSFLSFVKDRKELFITSLD